MPRTRPDDKGRDLHTGLPALGPDNLPVDPDVTRIYVDADAGDDGNSGGYADPVATLDKALAIARGLQSPTDPSGTFEVHEDTYISLATRAAGRYTLDMSQGWLCVAGSLIIGSPDVTVLDSGLVDSIDGNGEILTDAAQAWTVDEHVGKWVRFAPPGGTTTDEGTQYRQIVANDATTLTLARNFQLNEPQLDDAYDIFEPAVEVDVEGGPVLGNPALCYGAVRSGAPPYDSYGRTKFALENLAVFHPSGPAFLGVDFNMVELFTGSSTTFTDCQAGTIATDILGTLDRASYLDQYDGAGLTVDQNALCAGSCLFVGLVAPGVTVGRTGGAPLPDCTISAGRIYGGQNVGIQVSAGASLALATHPEPSAMVIRHLDGVSTGLSTGVRAQELARLNVGEWLNIDLTAQAGATGFRVNGGDARVDGNCTIAVGAGDQATLVETGRMCVEGGNGANWTVGGAAAGALAVGYTPTTAASGAGGPLAGVGGAHADTATLSAYVRTA